MRIGILAASKRRYSLVVLLSLILLFASLSANVKGSLPGTPSPPTEFHATFDASGVIFNWNLPSSDGGSPITNIEVYLEAGDPVNSTWTGTLFGDSTDYSIFSSDLNGGWDYTAYAIARNANGDSDPSNKVSFTATFIPGGIDPDDVTVESGDSYVKLTWLAPDDGGSPILQYNISRMIAGDFSSYQNVTVPAAQTYFNDTAVTNGVRYYYDIVAVNAVGHGWSGGLIEVTRGVPSPPLNFHLVDYNMTGIQLEWSPPVNAGAMEITAYRIYTGDFGRDLLYTASPDVFTYTSHDTELGGTYMFCVKAVNEYGESEWSDWARVDFPTSPPLNLTVTTGIGYANISWEEPALHGDYEVNMYDVERKGGNETEWTVIGQIYDASTSFLDDSSGGHNGPMNGVAYQYRVMAGNQGGYSDPSNVVTITIGTSADTGESDQTNANPDNSVIIIAGAIIAAVVVALLALVAFRRRKA